MRHVPGFGDNAKARLQTRTCLVGDFNTGPRIDAEGIPFTCSRYMTGLSTELDGCLAEAARR